MSWTGVKKVLENFKDRPELKEKLKVSLIRGYLQKKFGVKNVSFKKEKLEIKAGSSALLQEFFLRKDDIKKELNDYLKEEVVKEITVKRG
ncbi:MAG: hypothetical protein V1841_01335 [Patescibacteria group bacterium]